jgi:hypothetical protein
MMIAIDDDLWEVAESATVADRWDFVRAVTAASLGLMTATDPQLSPDGRRLVFLGVTTGGVRYIYGAVRTSRDAAFSEPMRLLDSTVLASPFLTADCSRLYVYNASVPVIEAYVKKVPE